jgi:hypothetical protein
VQPGENNPGAFRSFRAGMGGQIDLNALQRTATAIAAQYRRSMIAEGDILFHCAEPSGSRR